MLPRTHEAIIRFALARASGGWRAEDVDALLEGHRREDDHVLFGVRLRAAGLTHTYRPGRRFGELFATNAQDKMLRLARHAARTRDRRRAALLVGRACHLLGDMAVPARTRGVWHFAGDPLEAWLEARSDAELATLDTDATPTGAVSPAAIADALARASAAHAVDTTRTPWGRLAFDRLRRGARLDAEAVAAQARALFPLAIASTSALLCALAPPP